MRRLRITVTPAVVLATILILAACGGNGSGNDATTAPAETAAQAETTTAAPTTGAPATAPPMTEPPVTETTAGQSPATSASSSRPAADDGWKTLATLRSDDASWEELPGLLVSDPFTVKGKARVVLDMPDAGDLDGVILAIIPADQLSDPLTIIDAIREGTSLVLIPSAPIKEIEALDGTYVLLNSIPAESPWVVELQTP